MCYNLYSLVCLEDSAMKYVTFDASFELCPNCYVNMRQALKRIGELDPYGIERTTLKGGIRLPKKKFKDKDYINRGILNVRFALNRNLGKSGKFSNRMIIKSSQLKKKDLDGVYQFTTSIPGKDFVKIVAKTFFILWSFDPQFCQQLIADEYADMYLPKIKNNNNAFISMVPIQTNIIVRGSTSVTQGEEVRAYIKDIIK